MTEGFVGSDIETVCKKARLAAMERCFSSEEKAAQAGEGLRADMKDFQKALEEVGKRINVGRSTGSENTEDEVSLGRKTQSHRSKEKRK